MAEEHSSDFRPHEYPPFHSTDLCVAALESFQLSDLEPSNSLNSTKRKALLRSCQRDGCFYLSLDGGEDNPGLCSLNGGLMESAESLVQLLSPIFKLSQEEKDKYSPSDPLALFGYKRTGVTVVDAHNTPDCAEFFNLSKDDLAGTDTTSSHDSSLTEPAPTKPILPWPQVVLDHRAEIQTFMSACHELCLRVLDVLCSEYAFQPGTLRDLHRFNDTSGDHLRVIRGPARIETECRGWKQGEREQDRKDASQIHTPSHCDFGTITLLFNWLGGLQIEQDGMIKWVRPVPAHAIVLVGSALGRFTQQHQHQPQALLAPPCHPVKHRVVSAPGAQGRFPRYALGYLLRPEDDVLVRSLNSEPGVVRRSEVGSVSVDGEELPTAKEWIRRKAKELGIGAGISKRCVNAAWLDDDGGAAYSINLCEKSPEGSGEKETQYYRDN